MRGPQTIAKLVYKSNNYRLWYANNYGIQRVYKTTFTSLGGTTLYIYHKPKLLEL